MDRVERCSSGVALVEIEMEPLFYYATFNAGNFYNEIASIFK